MVETKNISRVYYPKKVGRKWQVWWAWSNGRIEANGAGEWCATLHGFWRWRTAARLANEFWATYNSGIWMAGNEETSKTQICS